MNETNRIVPVAVLAGSTAAQIVISHSLQNLRRSFFKVPDKLGINDEADIILDGQTSNYLFSKQVFDTVTFCGAGGGDLSYFDLTTQQVVTVPKMQLPIAIISVRKINRIVKSDIAGRNGSVKQYIALQDYDITIKGLFNTGIIDTFPKAAMKQLQSITSCTTEVKVQSNFLSLFGINYIVFEECEFNQEEDKGRDEQSFTLNCVSDTPFVIKVNNQGASTSNIDTFNGTVSAAPAPTIV